MISQLFNVANLFVLPFWALMILLPNWGVTRRVMESYIPYVVLASLYLYLFLSSITPQTAQALSSPQLADIARAFGDEKVEGQRRGIWTIHSLGLCLFAGPLGLLSHVLTSWISQKFFTRAEGEAKTVSSSTPSV